MIFSQIFQEGVKNDPQKKQFGIQFLITKLRFLGYLDHLNTQIVQMPRKLHENTYFYEKFSEWGGKI